MDEVMMRQGTEILAFAGYREFVSAADRTAVKIKEGFMEMGYILKVARDTDILQGSEYKNYEDFAEKRYDLDKGTVSRYIRIVERFSVGGNSHILQDGYRNVGFAKLSLMLHLSDEVAEELMDKYSKAEVQMVKEEIEAEQAISDIELAIEKAGTDAEEQPDASMLELTVWQLGREQPELYRKLWDIKTHCRLTEERTAVMEALAPDEDKIYMVRIPGTGKLMLSISGEAVSVTNVRNNQKEKYDTVDLNKAVGAVISPAADSAETSYMEVYGEPLQAVKKEKTDVVPVQPAKDKRKQSKVVRSRPKAEQSAAAVQPEPQKPEEEQVTGQMNVKDYPEVLPVNYHEIDEETRDAENRTNGATGETDTDSHGAAGRDGEKIQSDTEIGDENIDIEGVVEETETAGCAGGSGNAQVTPAADEASGDIHQLWKNVRIAKQLVDRFVDVLLGSEEMCLEEEWGNLQTAYDCSIDLAAAIERLLIIKEKEVLRQDG